MVFVVAFSGCFESDSDLWDEAISTGDSSKCDKINDGLRKERCYREVLLVNPDPSICSKMTGGYDRRECYEISAIKNEDYSICNNLLNLDERCNCYVSFTININEGKGDSSACGKLQDVGSKDSCYNQYGKFKDDLSACGKVQNNDLRYDCIAGVKEDPSFCAKIQDKKIKGECYYWRGYCGDGVCRDDENCQNGICTRNSETCSSCPEDCGKCAEPKPRKYCGDKYCNNGETCSSCPDDCGRCPEPEPTKTDCDTVARNTLNKYLNYLENGEYYEAMDMMVDKGTHKPLKSEDKTTLANLMEESAPDGMDGMSYKIINVKYVSSNECGVSFTE